jgi:hypothetical protein
LHDATGVISGEVRRLAAAGFNYYARGHKLKWTVDVVRALDPLPASNTGNGVVRSEGPQTAVRAQAQWRF